VSIANSPDERSLLLFFESCAVDRAGRVGSLHMNAEDFAIAERWHAAGFVEFGRLTSRHIRPPSGGRAALTHWCHLSDAAWAEAAAERRARAGRTAHKPSERTASRRAS
jgi:hypothetical protein